MIQILGQQNHSAKLRFVELYRFGKSAYRECVTDEERWCWTLKNMGRMTRTGGDTLMLPELEHLLESGMIAGFSREKRAKYDADMITERDMYNILETAREEGLEAGRAEGREEGLAEGKSEGKAEVAGKCLRRECRRSR